MPSSAHYTGESSLLRSLMSNWLGLVAAITIGFFLSPFVVHSLGEEIFGFWALITSITSQLMMLDLGVRNSVVKFLAEFQAKGDNDKTSQLLTSSFLILCLAAIGGLTLLLLVLWKFDVLFDIPLEHLNTVQLVFFIMALEASVELAFGVFDATLAGKERYDLLQGTNTVRLILNALLVVCVLHYGGGILGLALVTVSTRLLQRVCIAVLALKSTKKLTLAKHHVSKDMLCQVAGYSLWASVVVIASRIIYQVDTIIVGAYAEATMITLYAVPVIIIEQFRMFAQSGSTILTPRFSGLQASGDKNNSKEILIRWARVGSLLAVAVGTPLLISGKDFLILWMGPTFQGSHQVLLLLTIPFFVVIPALGFGNYLLGTGKQALYGKLLLLEACTNLALSLFLAPRMGLTGVALGTLFPAILFRGSLLPWFGCTLAKLSLYTYLKEGVTPVIPAFVAYACTLLSLRVAIGSDSWSSFLTTHALSASIFVILTTCFVLDQEERAYIARRLSRSNTE